MSTTQSMTLYRGSNGRPLSVRGSNVIGSGGEGSIYSLDEFPDLVAKVYHRPAATTGAKLRLMVDNPPTMPEGDGHISIAWPLDTLHSTRSSGSGTVVGFLMHRISSLQPVSQCYNPAARRRNFPHFTYKHLCAVAINIAIAVSAIHGHNYVIGDINESNIMVNDNGLVTLIDTDSFQVIDQSNGRVYRSPVGKPEYTPGELQGRNFGSVDRHEYHDRFGVGVLIYQLLMEGRHPHTGRYTGMGDSPAIEKNILLGHFLHSESRRVPLEDGVGSMRWETLDESIGELFRLCFDRGHDNQIVRPATEMWETAITQATISLAECTRSPQHLYFRHNRTCPWCERTRVLGGDDPFPVRSGPPPLIMRRTSTHHTQARPAAHKGTEARSYDPSWSSRDSASRVDSAQVIIASNTTHRQDIVPLSLEEIGRTVVIGSAAAVDGTVFGKRVELHDGLGRSSEEKTRVSSVYGIESVAVGNYCTVAGNVQSGGTIRIGKRSGVNGDLIGQRIVVEDDSSIAGNIIAHESISIGCRVLIGGYVVSLSGTIKVNEASRVFDIIAQGNVELGAGVNVSDPVILALEGEITQKGALQVGGIEIEPARHPSSSIGTNAKRFNASYYKKLQDELASNFARVST